MLAPLGSGPAKCRILPRDPVLPHHAVCSFMQGIVVATSKDQKQCTVDDGTGVLHLELKVFLKNAPPGVDARPQLGDYIMAIGPMLKTKTDTAVSTRTLVAHQVVKLDTKLQREPMWFLEVIEYWTSVVKDTHGT
ncbi:hypothetical protein PInf_007292 [Phytophthora infestans]|nr:hypothetical protein PInf_007292 [Phytophthora infestans]